MTQDIINWLMISSMIFFNIFCIIGIITLIIGAYSASKVRTKTVETLDLVQETTLNVSKVIQESSSSFISDILFFIIGSFMPFKRETKLQKLIKSIKK